MSGFLEQFYGYFETGYALEEFQKVYLEKIGLDEVVVTRRSSDGGIDLEAVRYGVGGFAGADAVDYGGAFLYNFKLSIMMWSSIRYSERKVKSLKEQQLSFW